jgi:glycine cleavage system H protein
MNNYLYSKDHEWVLPQDRRAKVGISEFAQSELGDIAVVELPEVGRQVARGEAVCSIDSLKSTSEIYAPVSGTILEVNGRLTDEQACEIINSDPLSGSC